MMQKKEGLTIMELLVVITILAILAVSTIALFNPLKQFSKGNDAKRKHEITQLGKVLEDYYNDKTQYPNETGICYTGYIQEGNTCSCYVCGTETTSPDFSPYMSRLACDPNHPMREYLYQYDCANQQWFKLYTQLSENNSYSYGVSSPNTEVEPYPTLTSPPPTKSPGTCQGNIYCNKGGICNICEPGDGCSAPRCDEPVVLYDDAVGGECVNVCVK